MNREILFKAKDKETNEWIEGTPITAENGVTYIAKSVQFSVLLSGNAGPLCNTLAGDFYSVIPETVSQFTGLYDKNGVRIWENDIVRYNDLAFNPDIGRFENKTFTSAVTYNLDNGCFSPFEPDTFESYIRAENVEVIGNRFDNPEFLKGK